MNSGYFPAIVESKLEDVQMHDACKRSGFLWLVKIIEKQEERKYFLICRIKEAGFQLKIEVKKDVYDQAKTEDRLSVYLEFKFEYAVYHFIKEGNQKRIINICDIRK